MQRIYTHRRESYYRGKIHSCARLHPRRRDGGAVLPLERAWARENGQAHPVVASRRLPVRSARHAISLEYREPSSCRGAPHIIAAEESSFGIVREFARVLFANCLGGDLVVGCSAAAAGRNNDLDPVVLVLGTRLGILCFYWLREMVIW